MFSLSLIGLVCCLAAANCIEYDIEDRVLVLNDSNFDVAIKEHKQVFVMFCLTFDKCEALAADCAKAAKQLEEEGSDIKLAKVHGNYESQLIWQYRHVFPRLTFFRDGQLVEYKGSCTVEEMTQWVQKTETPARLLTTVNDARALVDSANVTVVGFFKNQTSVEAKEFFKAAYTIEQHPSAITSEDAVYKELGASKDGVVLFEKFDEGKNTLALKPTRDKIRSFVAMNSQPLVVELTRKNTQNLLRGLIQQYSLLFFTKDIANLKEVMENFREAAAAFRLQVVFVVIDIDQENLEILLMYFQIWKDGVPALRFAKREGAGVTSFKPDTNSLKVEDIKTFVQGVLDGSIKDDPLLPFMRDSNAPFAQVVTQKNFDEVVFDKTKDVLVLFYSPWCNLCDRLAQIYDSLAHEYKDHKSLLIAKMDATTNELEHTEVHSFPTLRLYKKQTNEVVEYNGEQTREGLSDFTDATCGNSHSAEVESENDENEEKEVDDAVHADVYDEVDEDRNEDVDELADDGRDNEHKKRDEL
ncbi:protein disulfide-isomerase isoform X1 [Rhipicephalus microplus]|uniref:protein disulfide-isomerase isoform X1 n=1 Tax=Rhipicephalus microplus TaxID=6941 RepID=UPI003F6D4E6A